jgi:hypothetical protein
MSIARHHTEWLSLVPVSGPFLSLPVLMDAFNTGLEPHDPDHVRLLRQEFTKWQESLESGKADPASHRAWIKFVLSSTLDLDDRVSLEGQGISQSLQVEVPEHHEFLRPHFVVNDPNTNKPRLLVQFYPRSQELSSYVAGSHWKASPDTRMTELLHGTGVRLGLITNGEQWMLVDAPKGETTGFSSWYASLWLEEPITLRAFRSLLSANRFFNVPDDQTLEALLAKSSSNQQEVTDQLGYQVRKAVEVLIYSLDRADQDFGRELLKDVYPEQLYESALTVMMRLVFLFCAEERELIPSKPFPVYEQNYSVLTISKQLRELADQHGEELLERRYDAWPRLLAAFRAVFGGLKHSDIHIPAYGGSLFNPDRFPFLEGRKRGSVWTEAEASPLPVNNRTVLHLLEALQLLQVRVPGGGPAEARRLSFRALDIEQIGHVYEGLLDHTAKRATEPYLGLVGTRDKEPETPLAEIEKLVAKGEADLFKYLNEETGKKDAALKKLLKVELDSQLAARFRTAAQSDEALLQRIEPVAGLVRMDSFGYPVVIPAGSVFVTAGTDRRSSGTHYTPRSLTEPIVQYTLEPLVYIGPAEGLPKNEWKLKSAKEILALKICDMACGSGAFLVQATRYMAERLMEAWEIAKQANPSTPNITPEGLPSTGGVNESLIPDDPAERKLYAMRLIAQRCIYGVDKNPLAVEMAKLSLWLLTMAKDKPFEFLDHNIRCGDSLVGLHSIDQLKHFSLKPDPNDKVLFKAPLEDAVEEAIKLRLKLEDMPCNTVEDVQRQEKLLAEANEKMERLRCAADLLVAAEFWGETAKDKLEKVRRAAALAEKYVEGGSLEEFKELAAKERRGQLMFHWCLEFPEVIVKRGGFDAFVGNPPFLWGMRISTTFGLHFLRLLEGQVSQSLGTSDLCVHFLARAASVVRANGEIGLILVDTISQGDTREVGLAQLVERGFSIRNAIASQFWPGTAGVKIARVIIHSGDWYGGRELDGIPVNSITSRLSGGDEEVQPEKLAANSGKSFVGHYLMGQGFVLTVEESEVLIANEPRAKDVIFDYLRGEDVNQKPDQQTDEKVINFGTRAVSECERLYPRALERIRTLVKPERDQQKRKANRERWWQYAEVRPGLSQMLANRTTVIVQPFTTKYLGPTFTSAQKVFASPLVVIDSDDPAFLCVLHSSFHDQWVRKYSSKMGDRIRYSSSDCFETFPFPTALDDEHVEAYSHLVSIGTSFESWRSTLMQRRHVGMTTIFNLMHDPVEASPDIQKLRDLHVEMDNAVAAAYGWSDLKLDHGFHETKQGIRYTISESARREVLQRLLKLNHERYAEEVKQGLHGKKKGAAKKAAPEESGKPKATKKATQKATPMFDFGEDEE